MEPHDKASILDIPLAEVLRPNWEKAIYLLIFLLAAVSRFWDLGARAMSHDESLHALYSYYLYNGTGYQHSPMMHGPFLFHANALIYFLFGDNDYTARIVPALFGVFTVFSPLLLRRWLGRLGAILASVGLLISPLTLYYSRYIRNDIYIMAWTMLLIAALFHFLRSRKPKWFYLAATVLMLSLATKEVAYIFGFIGLAFLVGLVLWERTSPQRRPILYLGGALLALLFLVVGMLAGRAAAEAAATAEGAGSGFKLLSALLLVIGGSIPAILLSATLIPSRHPRPSRVMDAVRSLPWRAWLVALVVMILIYTLLFTTFFTNPAGLGTGIVGSIGYWLAQQEVERGGQPWYYYLLLVPMYEFLPFLFSLVAIVYYVVRPRRATDDGTQNTDDRPGTMDDGAWSEASPDRAEEAIFISFLIFWTLSTFFIYSWAGEKMPWLGVHPALPMIVLTAKFVGDLFERVNWRDIWQRGGGWLALLLPVTAFGLYTLVKVRPFQGLSIFKLQETGNWLLALLITLTLLLLTGLVVRRLRVRNAAPVALATLLAVLALFTVRFAWLASFVNYDYATELLVYAHGGADVVPTMDEVANISARTVGDKAIEVAYDNEVTWPLEWYLRQYPNRKYFGDQPSRAALSTPVILYSERNAGKVEPYLGERYDCSKRRLMWWPNQQYMGLTWERVRDILGSPEKRKILWNILYWRKYPQSPDNWYHVHNFYLCVRKDVAQSLWDWGAVPPEAVELPPDPYLEAQVELQAVSAWGTLGTESGQFNHPRGLAVGPDGNVYVVDSDNYRVQVFAPDGTYLRGWGSRCNLQDGIGCADPDGSGPLEPGDGQFQEPWGIAVSDEGRVYVADTWNHRIQVFDENGTFLAKWGIYGETQSLASILYGPRDVAIDAQGRVLVSDTGNKRVLVYDREGNLLEQFGGGGVAPGLMDEPVGLGVDPTGNIYVADTWNQRVQVFGELLTLERYWGVEAWFGQSVVNKPYLAVDGQGRVYVTDPEGYRVIVFTAEGTLVAVFGQYGADAASFRLPTGIDVDSEGYVYVSDTDGQRVMRFPPLP